MDFIPVNDVVSASIAAMDWDGRAGIFNIGTGQATSVNEIAKLLIQKLAPDIRPVYEAERAGEIKNSLADISQARKLLHFEPEVKLVESIDDIIAWNRKARELSGV